MTAHTAETNRHTIRVPILLDRQALTEEPYRKMFSAGLLLRIAAAPMMGRPVPRAKLEAMDTPK